MLVLTITTNVATSGTFPVFFMFTSSADESLWPLVIKEVVIACLFSGKTLIKLCFVFWEVFNNNNVGHSWSPSRIVVFTSITDDLVRCGQSQTVFSLENYGYPNKQFYKIERIFRAINKIFILLLQLNLFLEQHLSYNSVLIIL